MEGMRGDPVQFELSTSTAGTATALNLRDAGGSSRTLAADERLIINALTSVIATAASPCIIFDDYNNDGNIAADSRLVVLGSLSTNCVCSLEGPDGGTSGGLGRVPKVKAAGSGLVNIAGVGYIQKN